VPAHASALDAVPSRAVTHECFEQRLRLAEQRAVGRREELLGEAKTLLKAFVRDRARGHGIER
jgi:hypothetical protein